MIALDAISVAAASSPSSACSGRCSSGIFWLRGDRWATYQDAVATSGAAENVFWSAMPAMALFTGASCRAPDDNEPEH